MSENLGSMMCKPFGSHDAQGIPESSCLHPVALVDVEGCIRRCIIAWQERSSILGLLLRSEVQVLGLRVCGLGLRKQSRVCVRDKLQVSLQKQARLSYSSRIA